MSKIWNASKANTHVTAHVSEKWAQEELLNLSRYYRKFKSDALQGIEPSNLPERKKVNLLLRFVKDMPSIIGVDLKTHGPFKEEDVAILPYENAESLIRQGTAVEIRTSPTA